ncbi:MAG: 3-isopropylmalate dehydrogenase [SAR324 cluster bacterium]|nr:3-isopropylmalate dehydrogenase [SAR324 cluster bacterium]
MKNFKIAVLAGDGIGPEIMNQALKVLDVIENRNDVSFERLPANFGACAYFSDGKSFPDQTIAICDDADTILKGTIGLGHEESQKIPVEERPERGALLPLRKRYNTYANFRPVSLPAELSHFSPLKPHIIGNGIDIMMIRELVGGLYFGEKKKGVDKAGKRWVQETLEYDEDQISRILHVAFETSMKRKKVLHNIHKSNVLISSVMWNEILDEITPQYPEVIVKHMLVDAAATALCLNPGQFDVMVMENMFGDILSDQGGGILGSLGLMPSACIGDKKSYFEPSHGSAPDIAGQNIAYPYAMVGSMAMMLDMVMGLEQESKNIWKAMQRVFAEGYSTPDLSNSDSDIKMIGTDAFGDRIVAHLKNV